MAKKYNSLKNLTPEEYKAYKRKQKARIQAKYYRAHKEEIKARNNGRYNYCRIYKNTLERLNNYINSEEVLDKKQIQAILAEANIQHQKIFHRTYSFYRKEMNMGRVSLELLEVISNLSFQEICKMFREICYDQVRYDSSEIKGIIYKEDRSSLNREQACQLQRKVSTAVDLFSQSVLDGREFDESYLEERLGK